MEEKSISEGGFMKRIILLIAAFNCMVFITNAQVFSLYINFEDTITVKEVKTDTANHNNIWQIGAPAKTVFTSAYSLPNAIVTDTIMPYPINNHSAFIVTISSLSWFWGSPSMLGFRHRYDTDSGKDGGYVDVSYNGGISWTNIIQDTILNSCPMYPGGGPLPWFNNIYSASDTISGGIPAFTGNSNGWKYTGITWLFCLGVKAFPPDSVMFRFNFKSDSLQSNKDGWIIDNIFFSSSECSVIRDYSVSDHLQAEVYPNPAKDIITVELLDNSCSAKIEILNMQDQLIRSIDISGASTAINISDFARGLYFVKVTTAKGAAIKKFLKE